MKRKIKCNIADSTQIQEESKAELQRKLNTLEEIVSDLKSADERYGGLYLGMSDEAEAHLQGIHDAFEEAIQIVEDAIKDVKFDLKYI